MAEDPPHIPDRNQAGDDAASDDGEPLRVEADDLKRAIPRTVFTYRPAGGDTVPTVVPEEPRAIPRTLKPTDTRPEPPGEKAPPLRLSGVKVGPYEVAEEVGRGGMGVVYKAWQPDLRRIVALKVLVAGEDASEEAVQRFHREAEAVARLGHHPGIVPVYDIGRDGHRHWFAMLFVEGRALDRVIADGPLDPREAARIARRVADALHHAHLHGIFHRDVKPSNILLAGSAEKITDPGEESEPRTRSLPPPSGAPMLTDFGLAKDLESESKLTTSGVTLGTPQYMSPEQASGKLAAIDGRSDVFSLGATLYEMLTGRPPFEGASLVEMIQKVLLREPAPPRKHNPAVEAELETICLTCLEKEPARRYGSARALAEDLDRYLAGRPILASPPSVVTRISRKLRRNRPLAAALVVLAAVVSVGSVLGFAAWTRWRAETSNLEAGQRDAQRGSNSAQDAARRAETSLEKGLAVSAVLREAAAELEPVLRDLKKAHYAERSPEERLRVLLSHREALDAFEKGLPDSLAARATWLAIKGWFAHLAGQEDIAAAAYAKARREDPEVPYGWLLESLGWLGRYLDEAPLPAVTVNMLGWFVGAPPKETPDRIGLREKYESILGELEGRATLWGSASQDFRAVLEGLNALHAGDRVAAERGLTRALALPEMVWAREGILLARARTRYYAGDFPAALADVERVLRDHPENITALRFKGWILTGTGVTASLSGDDGQRSFEDALKAFDALLRLNPQSGTFHTYRASTVLTMGEVAERRGEDAMDLYLRAVTDINTALDRAKDPSLPLATRALAYSYIARLRLHRGLDPGEAVGQALEDAERALKERPWDVTLHLTAGNIYEIRGQWAGLRGRDPVPDLRRAIVAFDLAERADPGYALIRMTRGSSYCSLGEALGRRGGEGEDCYRKALADFEFVLARYPGSAVAFNNRAAAYGGLGEILELRGEEGMEYLERACKDCDQALLLDPTLAPVHHNRALALTQLARRDVTLGRDPRPKLEQALDALGKVLARDPRELSALASRSRTLSELAAAQMAFGGDWNATLAQALADAEQALEINPDLLDGHTARGTALETRGDALLHRGADARADFEAAVQAYTEVLARNPESARAFNHRSYARHRLGSARAVRGEDGREDFHLSIQDADAALARNPEYVFATFNRGRARMGLGEALAATPRGGREEIRSAIADFTLVLQRNGAHQQARNSRGNACVTLAAILGRRGEDAREPLRAAMEDFRVLLGADPDSAAARNNLANACANLARATEDLGEDGSALYADAVESYRALVEKRPSLWQAHANLGLIHLETAHYEEAVQAFAKAVSITKGKLPILETLHEEAVALREAPAWRRQADGAQRRMLRGGYAAARPLFEEALEAAAKARAADDAGNHPALARMHYNLACILSQGSAGRAAPGAPLPPEPPADAAALKRAALAHLAKAVGLGFTEIGAARTDADLEPLRDDPGFERALTGK